MLSTVSDASTPQLAPSIKSPKLQYQARALLLPAPQVEKISASKLIHYFSGHPVVFGFLASLPPDNVTLNPASKRVDLSLSDWHCAPMATHANLDTAQLISHTRIALVNAIASFRVLMVV